MQGDRQPFQTKETTMPKPYKPFPWDLALLFVIGVVSLAWFLVLAVRGPAVPEDPPRVFDPYRGDR